MKKVIEQHVTLCDNCDNLISENTLHIYLGIDVLADIFLKIKGGKHKTFDRYLDFCCADCVGRFFRDKTQELITKSVVAGNIKIGTGRKVVIIDDPEEEEEGVDL